MRLSDVEFKAMNNPVRRFLQRHFEYRLYRKMGLTRKNQDILEIGCGSGYGAVLLSELQPRSYVGVDVMPEQIALAEAAARDHHLEHVAFRVQDATRLEDIPARSQDTVVIFGVLHHIPPWREVIAECARVLRAGGQLFVEEPDGGMLDWWERFFHWGHTEAASFRLEALEQTLRAAGFTLERQWKLPGVAGVYAARKV